MQSPWHNHGQRTRPECVQKKLACGGTAGHRSWPGSKSAMDDQGRISCGRSFARKIFGASPRRNSIRRKVAHGLGRHVDDLPARMSLRRFLNASFAFRVKRVVFTSLHFHLAVSMVFFPPSDNAVSPQRDVYRHSPCYNSIIKERVLRTAKTRTFFVTITGFKHYYGLEPFKIGNLIRCIKRAGQSV